MKHSNLLLIFIFFTLPFFVIYNVKSNFYSEVNYRKVELNSYIDKAVMDSMAVNTTDNKKKITKEEVSRVFFNTLNLNIGLFEDKIGRATIESYVPAIVLIEYDGIYVESYMQSGEEFIRSWGSKVPFSIIEDTYLINFTLTEDIIVNDLSNNLSKTSHYSNFATIFSFCQNYDDFIEMKNKTIKNIIIREAEHHINEHNMFGATYQFFLPEIEEGDWNNLIKDVSVIAFVQNLPLVGDVVYNNYAVGGSTTYNDVKYYIESIVIDDEEKKFIHSEDCTLFDIEKSTVVKSIGRSIDYGILPHNCLH